MKARYQLALLFLVAGSALFAFANAKPLQKEVHPANRQHRRHNHQGGKVLTAAGTQHLESANPKKHHAHHEHHGSSKKLHKEADSIKDGVLARHRRQATTSAPLDGTTTATIVLVVLALIFAVIIIILVLITLITYCK